MTFAIQPYVKAEIQDIDRARSEESFVIAKAFERSLEHFLKPF
jgi:hypothetical protein